MSRTAAPGARDQVARLLTLVPFLHHRDGVRLEEAAQLLGTTPQQVVRDLKVLFMCGLPGGLPDDLIDVDLDAIVTEEGSPVTEGVIRVENADYLARPLRLSATEASAMIVALRMLRDTAAAGATPELVDRVLAKLEAAAGAPHVEITPSPRDAQQVVAAQLGALVEEAVATNRQIRLLYFVPSRDEESERVVDAYGVVTHGVFSYLDAYCHRAEGDRLFRLDRITKAELLPSARTAPDREPRDLSDGLFTDDAAPDATVVTLRLGPQARWATDYYPMRDVRPHDDGSAEVDLVVVDRRWLTRLLLRLAPHATVVRPVEFTDTFTARAQETLRLYR
ncbi:MULTISPECIES: YafY family protein [unclassified Nocardioides]|uniref:helix-turn-helix transcriptional regulator n=1 Tax=unclassified Nocardioides TaxID=2615069 RepID=UPI0011504DD3|nr:MULTISPECIES: WYL domain-containing protein [unclassified Nocardioides]TQK71116.1 proteasome accessory factor C [Nocardioides sp. SLBN-35]WGY04702.1 WYL domain-containing protein [Nocardioides sp. QY071]